MANVESSTPACEKVASDVATEVDPEIAEILAIVRSALMGVSLRRQQAAIGHGEMLKRRLAEVNRG